LEERYVLTACGMMREHPAASSVDSPLEKERAMDDQTLTDTNFEGQEWLREKTRLYKRATRWFAVLLAATLLFASYWLLGPDGKPEAVLSDPSVMQAASGTWPDGSPRINPSVAEAPSQSSGAEPQPGAQPQTPPAK
jgi:hypothetical protein